MKAIFKGLNKKGITPVISTVILTAVVMAIGGAVWAYSQGASNSVAKDYVEGMMSLMDETVERFTVEHVGYDNQNNRLNIWIYNYGGVNIVVDVYANTENGTLVSKLENTITSKTIIKVDVPLGATVGSEIAIKVVSRRSNNAYSTYIIP